MPNLASEIQEGVDTPSMERHDSMQFLPEMTTLSPQSSVCGPIRKEDVPNAIFSEQQPNGQLVPGHDACGISVSDGGHCDDNVTAVDLARIQSGLETRTIVVVRRLPRKLTEDDIMTTLGLVMDILQIHYMYLPWNCRNGRNKGYAFFAFQTPTQVVDLYRLVHGRRWPAAMSMGGCQVSFASTSYMDIPRENAM